VRDGRVEQALQLDVRARGDRVDQRPTELAQRAQQLLAALDRTGEAGAHADDRAPVDVLRQERQRRRLAQVEDRGELVERVGDEVAVEAQQLRRVLERVEDRASTVGPTGCSRYSNAVTTPKLPPPPRSPQNRSGSSRSLARSSSPSAVTTSAERRLSTVAP
jgi:hypothetical protein